jgi:phosphate butyryltransferase
VINIKIKTFSDVIEAAAQKRAVAGASKIAIAAGESVCALNAANSAVSANLASVILVGDRLKIEKSADVAGICLTQFEIVDIKEPFEACKVAARLVSGGEAAALMKGDTPTAMVLRAALDRDIGLRTGKKLSHVAMFSTPSYHKPFIVTDCAVNIAPDFETKADIIENAVGVMRKLGVSLPKVALLAAKETVDEKMPVTLEWARILELHRQGERMQDCIVDGPFALDNAISNRACEIKGVNSPVGGDADILVVPNIEAGNILYKCLTFIAKADSCGIVVGAKRPIILTSRADCTNSRLNAIALAVLL